jgi:uncharacterized protein YchJ
MEKGWAARPIAKGILKLARQIDASSTPEYVAVESVEGCMAGQSFQNVALVVRQQGGSVQHGWAFRVQPSAYVEGAFHAIWRRPDGSLIDVTPRRDDLTETLFMVDNRNVWQGEDVEPRRMMLHEQPCYCGSGMPYKICHGLADD